MLVAGPLVYPAGFVYVYSGLKHLTGGSVATAQPLFAALYVATLAVVLAVYIRAKALPPLALPLLCLSKRMHSLYVLRLFNDCVAMLPAFGMVALAQRGHWCVCDARSLRRGTEAAHLAAQAGSQLGVERSREREDECAAVRPGPGAPHAAGLQDRHHICRRRACDCHAGASMRMAGSRGCAHPPTHVATSPSGGAGRPLPGCPPGAVPGPRL